MSHGHKGIVEQSHKTKMAYTVFIHGSWMEHLGFKYIKARLDRQWITMIIDHNRRWLRLVILGTDNFAGAFLAGKNLKKLT